MKRKFISRQRTLRILVLAVLLGAIAVALWLLGSRTALPRTADTGVQKSLFEAASRGSKPASLGAVEHPSVSEKDTVLPDAQRRKQQQEAAFKNLPQSEQQSLWTAFSEAKRAIQPLTEQEAAMPQNKGVKFFAANPGQQLAARFLDGAVRVESGRDGAWAGTLEFQGTTPVAPVLAGKRVEYRHSDGVTEWYENVDGGIEHGFTLATRPQTAAAGEVRMEFALRGLSARTVAGEEALDFVDAATGAAVLRYSKLKVWDAVGREMPAHFEAKGGRVAILVADVGATYPLTIDPIITSQEAKLTASDGAANDLFGGSVALSGDTALVGAQEDDTAAGANAGSAYVFVRSGTVWSQQAKLTASDKAAYDYFGSSVALSGDTALVGAYYNTTGSIRAGSSYVFVRTGTVWSQQTKLTASDGANSALFGFSVALSGNTALVGAKNDHTAAGLNAGSAYVFVRSGTAWSQQAKLTASDSAAGDYFGNSVALSGDTALVGAVSGDTGSAGYL